MSEPRRNPLRVGATISPGRYFMIGCLLSLIKIPLDWLVATSVFGRPWSPLSYAITGEIGGLFSLDRNDQSFYATMLALALPFILIGVALTVQRLRDAGWPLWLVAVFFVPMPINLVFFIVLCLVPGRSSAVHGGLSDIIDLPEAMSSKSLDTQPRVAYARAAAAILKEAPCTSTVSGRPRTGDSGQTRSSMPFTIACSGTSRR
jgi:uncharacterized membrane protein YhaH (DUF805 family)